MRISGRNQVMTTNRARGVWAALLALLIAAQIPATALGGEAGKSFVPDPEPMPATGDPDVPIGSIVWGGGFGWMQLPVFVWVPNGRLAHQHRPVSNSVTTPTRETAAPVVPCRRASK